MTTSKNAPLTKLAQIIEEMNSEYPLVDLCEDLELSSNGKFTFLSLRETLDRLYPNTSKADKIFLLKHISIKSLGINYSSVLISLLNLFRFFEKIIHKKILSPLLFFYSITEILEQQFKTPTLEFIYSIGLTMSSIININEFFQKISQKLKLDDLTSLIIFKGLDFDKNGTIRIEDFVLVIDSYREDLLQQDGKQEEEAVFNAELFTIFLEKNFVSIDELYKAAQYNYLDYEGLRKTLMNEFSKEDNHEAVINSVLFRCQKNKRVFKEDLEKYLQRNSKTAKPIKRVNEIQYYWINKYIETISTVSITPKMAFESSLNKRNMDNVINLEDLKRTVKILLPEPNFNHIELNDMINAFDVNKNRLIEYNQYEELINYVETVKQPNTYRKQALKNNLVGTASKVPKLVNYHLLPVKGNRKVLSELKKEVQRNIQMKAEGGLALTKQGDKKNNNMFAEEDQVIGDCNANIEDTSIIPNKGRRLYKNTPNGDIDNDMMLLNEYKDEFDLIQALEHFNYESQHFTCFDLLNHLILQYDYTKAKASNIIKVLDKNNDGFISLLDIITFLLYQLRQRSTKLALKYLYMKIYKEYKLNADDFFIKNNLDIYNEININELCNFFIQIKIEAPITNKLFDEMKVIFPYPLTYKNVIELIDEQKEREGRFLIKSATNDNKLINMNALEEGVKKILNQLTDDDEYINTELLKAKNFRENIKTILDKNDNIMTLEEYKLNFIKPLQIDMFIGLTIFQLLKSINTKGEQFITQKDLIVFLESYIQVEHNENNEQDEWRMDELVSQLESNGSPMKYVFEKIAFSTNGLIPTCEIMKCLLKFYPLTSRHSLTKIIKEIDQKQCGYVAYNQLQLFLYNYSKHDSFSIDLEVKNIASNLLREKAIISANDYFGSQGFQKIIDNYNNITKDSHDKLMTDIVSSNKNRDALFDYLCRIDGKASGYDINHICNMINKLILQTESPVTITDEIIPLQEKITLPKAKEVENSVLKLSLGSHGKVSMVDFVLKFEDVSIDRKYLALQIDKKKTGYVDYLDFISDLRAIYGNEINLNINLCAMYMFKEFINKWEEIENWILSKVKAKDISKCLAHDTLYSLFLFGFGYDKTLFESFFSLYKEKRGKNIGLLNLVNLSKFIQSHNLEDKPSEISKANEDKNEDNRLSHNEQTKKDVQENPKISLEEQVKHILNTYETKSMPAKNIIDMLQLKNMNLKADFTIKDSYFKTFIGANLNFIDEDIESISKLFVIESTRFHIKKFADFIQLYCPKSKSDISFDVIPKIKKEIQVASNKTYKSFVEEFFKKDFLNIVEVVSSFEIFKISLYECLILIQNESFLSIDKLFNEYFLKELFSSNELDSSLKLSLKKLSDYFDKHKDKLKLFKQYDLDKNGVLTPDEFITALNSFKDLGLNDSQKILILKVADQNKDGRINPKEFLNFIKTIKSIDQKENIDSSNQNFNPTNSSNLPMMTMTQTKFYPKIVTSTTLTEGNLKYNKQCLKKNKDTYLNYMIILQEDFIKNINNYECLEQDFVLADEKSEGAVTIEKFATILKKRLFVISNNILNQLISFAHQGMPPKAKAQNITEKRITYKYFLNNLSEYRYVDNSRLKSQSVMPAI